MSHCREKRGRPSKVNQVKQWGGTDDILSNGEREIERVRTELTQTRRSHEAVFVPSPLHRSAERGGREREVTWPVLMYMMVSTDRLPQDPILVGERGGGWDGGRERKIDARR